ncbi:MAG: hypothetical protein F6K19_02025 [Cyanothece sp. SIO1E1]|nr:hypothetical protein [Cyanothece sp. SIO1E1]
MMKTLLAGHWNHVFSSLTVALMLSGIMHRTDIYAGVFTIEYAEEDLLRSITFRLPIEEDEGESGEEAEPTEVTEANP